MVLCALFWTASTVLFLVGCRPISWYWNRVTDPEGMGECIDTEQFYFWTGVCDTVLDALVLVVPIQNGMSTSSTVDGMAARNSQTGARSGGRELGLCG